MVPRPRTQDFLQILDGGDSEIEVFLRRAHLYKSHTSLKKKVKLSTNFFVAPLFTNVSYTDLNIQDKDASNKIIMGVILLMKEGATLTSTSQIYCLRNREFVSSSKQLVAAIEGVFPFEKDTTPLWRSMDTRANDNCVHCQFLARIELILVLGISVKK